MKASTFVELAGFTCWSVAGFTWRTVPVGWVVTGFCLLLVGYATEDNAAVVAVGRILAPVRVRRARHKMRRDSRAKRKAA